MLGTATTPRVAISIHAPAAALGSTVEALKEPLSAVERLGLDGFTARRGG